VPSTTTYDAWLRKQPQAFQEDVLGKSKAQLFRDGLTLDKFVDEKGKSYTLAELNAHVHGDKLNVVQPQIGMKAKALLQQGLEPQEVIDAIKKEFPEANTTAASIASYKSELKKAGLMDDIKTNIPTSTFKKNQSATSSLFHHDESLPAGVKYAVGQQWATVVEKIDGVPGAYAHYQAGKGVMVDASKLSTISAPQAQQVLAHEFGHMLHKQHEVELSDFYKQNLMGMAQDKLSPNGKKLYGYYLSHYDELVAEIHAQALSPSPITSQGLSATEFRSVFAGPIDSAKYIIQQKFPVPSVKSPQVVPGGPTLPMEVAGKHTSASSLAKAMLQQNTSEQTIWAAIEKQFPDVKNPAATVASAKSQLKKAGLLNAVGQSGPTISVKVAPEVAPPLYKPEVQVLAQKAAAKAEPKALGQLLEPALDAGKPLSGVQLKSLGVELFEDGVLDNKTVADTLKLKHPASAHLIKTENVASWKTNWKKQFPSRFAEAEAKAKEAAKTVKAAQKATLTPPKLAGTPLGPQSSKALQELKQHFQLGGELDVAHAILKTKYFTNTYKESMGQDLIDLAKYEVATGKVVAKPYMAGAYSAPPPPPPKIKVDMTPSRPALTPREGFPPPPRFTAEQQRAGIEQWAGHFSPGKLNSMNAEQKRLGLEMLTPEESASIAAYTGSTYRKLNSALRSGKYASDLGLQAYVEAAQSALRKMPAHKGVVQRGITLQPSAMAEVLGVYRPGAIVEEHAFISSSYGGKAAFSGNMYLHITSKSGRNVTGLSVYGTGEREVLFMPGVKLKITKVENLGSTYNVHMEEVD
jgi:hypothetical protein